MKEIPNKLDIEKLKEQIMNDDAFVIDEISRLQYLYRMKLVIRNNLKREVQDVTESVAEHIYGMFLLMEYFLPLEGLGMDKEKISAMILYHDTPEIEVGDIVTHHKTDADRVVEAEAIHVVISKAPHGLRHHLDKNLNLYEKQDSKEARFVKAIDKLEAVLQHYDERMKPVFRTLEFDLIALEASKEKYIRPYPFLWRFYSILKQRYIEEKFI